MDKLTGATARDPRLAGLVRWLESVLAGTAFTLAPASEDASFRRYFRVSTQDHSLIAMDAPPEKEDSGPFVDVARRLEACGVNVPRILEFDSRQGYLLLTDLGSRQYLRALNEGGQEQGLYGQAISTLVRFQARADVSGLPPYGRERLMTEMALFEDWLLKAHLAQVLTTAEARRLRDCFHFLADEALLQPRVFVHRDYHSRNLMVGPGGEPGVLDFQDAMHGPVTYDLVSLLKDCYIKWPRDRILDWLADYLDQARAAGIDIGGGNDAFVRSFDLMGVQRHLKAAGIFARLWLRDGKSGFLADIPRTLSYITDCAEVCEELGFLAELIETRVLPGLSVTVAQAP